MGTEIELKFRIPLARLPALRRAVATASATVQPLAAAYFDTPGQHLAAARMALRLRREGDAWVQTLKAEGAGPLQRLEHNAPLPANCHRDSRPGLDICRHDGTAAGVALRRLLADAGQPALQQRYATTVQRTRRLLRSGGALIELALDEGTVQAGSRSLVLCEIEFELLSGTPEALLALAGRWAARHGLLLDVRSKSELGHTLAAGLRASPPSPGRPLRLAQQAGLVDARCAMLNQVLRQVLANASQIAAGPSEPGHLHHLRVGLRRLLGVLGACWPAGPAGVADDVAAARQALAVLYRQLGAPRDADAMSARLRPVLQAPGVQQLWLALIGLGLPPEPAS